MTRGLDGGGAARRATGRERADGERVPDRRPLIACDRDSSRLENGVSRWPGRVTAEAGRVQGSSDCITGEEIGWMGSGDSPVGGVG